MEDSNIRQQMLEKLEKIKAAGWNPYPASYPKKQMIGQTRDMEGQTVSTAGRMFSFRTHGNIAFADLKDESGKIQLFFKKDLLGEEAYNNLKLLDLGDFIGVTGEVVKTTVGEISIAPTSYTLLSKVLRPLPSEWFGVKDMETRYRQRYLDLLINPGVRERFQLRTLLVRGVREYLDGIGFWEVETPTLQSLYGGANAKPFKTHMNALGKDMFLRIADELYLKRLIIGGYERVYEICKDFRNEGIDQTHSPEFTMIEWYEAYADYHRVMDVAEGLCKHLAQKLHGDTKLKIEDKTIDVGGSWPRIRMVDILKEKLGLAVEEETTESLLEFAKLHCPHMEIIGGETKGQLIFMIFDHMIPKTLIEPTWIIDYPEDISPLSKPHRDYPGWVERFEGYVGGKEIFDGWSELTDPQIQRERFKKDTAAVREDKTEGQQTDEEFLLAMEHGMPPTGGIGVGIDRLAMFFSNTWAIKEVILFPTLKSEATKLDQAKAELPLAGRNENTEEGGLLTIAPEVKEKFPSISVGVAVIKRVTVAESNDELKKEIAEVVESFKGIINEQIGELEEVQSYRKLYKETGVDYHSRRPSPEALLRRLSQGKDLYSVNSCVDAYNCVVLKEHVSVGAFDLDTLVLPAKLTLATGSETIDLLGDDEVTPIKGGETIYTDENGPYNLDFNYRDSKRTAVSTETKNILVNVDGIYSITPEKVEKVLKEVCDIIMRYCGGTLESLAVVK